VAPDGRSAVNGPLTAGLIPWGFGQFTFASLTTAQVAATEVTLDGKRQVQMTLAWADGSSTKLTLDPSKGYAVAAATLPIRNNLLVSYLCSDYEQVGGKWVPSEIVIERRDATTGKVLRSEQWTLTVIDAATPSLDSFTIKFPPDTQIEYISSVTTTPQAYQSPAAGGDRLVADRLTYVATEGKDPQNCATAALRYVASQLGKPVSDSRLARLVDPNHQTSLSAMKAFARELGLYCRAVKTDIATLRDLDGVQVILHIPDKRHYVVLDEVDDQSVRLIDLSSNKFCYPQSVHSFPADWSEGTALLLSDRPIPGRFTELPDATLTAVFGGYWTCTKLYQEESWVDCSSTCPSLYQFYWRRFTCESAPAGSCQGTVFVRYQECPCDWDRFFTCMPTSEWVYHYMRGCYP
jgi:hypothetical protein